MSLEMLSSEKKKKERENLFCYLYLLFPNCKFILVIILEKKKESHNVYDLQSSHDTQGGSCASGEPRPGGSSTS